MTTAHGHGGVTSFGPQHPHRWTLILAFFAIAAVGIAAVALITSQSQSPTAPEAATPAATRSVLEAPMTMDEINHLLAHPAAIASGGPLIAITLTAQQMDEINHLLAHPAAIASGGPLIGTTLTAEEYALITESATGLVPTGALGGKADSGSG